MNWFSPHQGLDWDVNKHGFAPSFADQVKLIRQWFKLSRQEIGLEVGTGFWRPYVFKPHHCGWNHASWSQDYPCSVMVTRFHWLRVRQVEASPPYLTPQFRLDVQIADKDGQVIFTGPLVIEFFDNYPTKPPHFRVDQPKYAAFRGVDGSHHMHKDGWMCIMGGGYLGYTEADWNPAVDTIITALNRALELIVWHVTEYRW